MRCARRDRAALDHLADELVAPTVDRPDEPLPAAVVADRPAGRPDPARQRGLGDETVAPDRVQQLLFGHHPVPLLHQDRQQREDLRLDRFAAPVATKVVSTQVEFGSLELEDQEATSPVVGPEPASLTTAT
jgi:hypothetical protein